MLTSHALSNSPEFNISPDGTMTLKGLFIMLWTFSIFLMNAGEANECVAPESISTYTPDITEGFPSASVLVSVNTWGLAFSYCIPFYGQSLMKCPSFPHLKYVLVFAQHSPRRLLLRWLHVGFYGTSFWWFFGRLLLLWSWTTGIPFFLLLFERRPSWLAWKFLLYMLPLFFRFFP